MGARAFPVSNGSGIATNSASRPDASTTTSVIPLTFSGGFSPAVGYSRSRMAGA